MGAGTVLQAGAFLPGTPTTLAGRLLWSALAILMVAFAVVVIWESGPKLKRWLDEDLAEAMQAAAGTVLGGIGAAVLVIVWRAMDDVREAFAVIKFGPKTGVLLMVTILGLAGAYTITRVTKRLVKTGVGRGAISAHQREVLHHVIQTAIMIPTALFILALWGVKPTRLLLGAGAAGVILGLAARQTLGSVIAGFVLLFARPFEVGDWVIIDEQEGTVTDVSIFNTQLRTFDNEDVLIPNDEVTSNNIINRSRRGRLRISVDVGIDYDADVERATEVIQETMEHLDAVDEQPPPDVVYKQFGDSAVVLQARFWITDPSISKKWHAQNEVVQAVKDALEAEGIKIPFPQRELMAREETEGFQVRKGTNGAAPKQAVERVEGDDR